LYKKLYLLYKKLYLFYSSEKNLRGIHYGGGYVSSSQDMIIGIYQVMIKWKLGYEYHFHIKVNISCQHLEFVFENYQFRWMLAIVSSVEGKATVDL
jgi:hypothetical protein